MYIKDGQIVKKAVIEIDGKYYGFNDDGIMYTDRSFVIWGSTSHAYYRARKDGSLYVNEWYFEGRSDYTTAYYYGSDGKGYSGLQEIDGKKYCFFDNGSLLVDTIFTNTDKTIYYCDSGGNTAELNNNDWTKVGEKTFYVKDGKALQSCVAEINGAYYGFNNIGIMFSNTNFELIWSQTPGSYRAKEDGSLYVLQWYQDAAGNWFYYDKTGILKTGGNA
jgi:glucan-binding YG repeat protein